MTAPTEASSVPDFSSRPMQFTVIAASFTTEPIGRTHGSMRLRFVLQICNL